MRFRGKLGALTGFKIEHIRPLRRALRQGKLPCLCNRIRIKAEGRVALLRACDGLEDQIGRGAGFDGAHLCCDMSQHAGLGRNLIFLLDLFKACQNLLCAFRRVSGRIQTDHRIPRAEA